MKASTLSVLLQGSKSVHVWAKTGRHSMNLSVRFDQGPAATICGYPQNAVIWDYQVEQFNSDSPTGREYLDDCGELPKGQFYVSEEFEIEILKAVIRGIKRQATDPMFKDSATAEFREECIQDCERRSGLLYNELPVRVIKAKKADAHKMGIHLLNPTKQELAEAKVNKDGFGAVYVHTKATWPKAGAK